jgi:hypothetical protein
MSSYVTKYNNSTITGTNLDIGTLFCDLSHDQTINGTKTFADVTISGNLVVNNVNTYNGGHHANFEDVTAGNDLTVNGNLTANTAGKIANFNNINVNGAFTGTPRAPTPATDASGTQIVNAAWVINKNYVDYHDFVFSSYIFRWGVTNIDVKYLNNGSEQTICSDSDAANAGTIPIEFGYGIYMCCMRGNRDSRSTCNVEWVRISNTYESSSCLNGKIADGDITRLHFKACSETYKNRINIWGNTDSTTGESLTLAIYRLI